MLNYWPQLAKILGKLNSYICIAPMRTLEIRSKYLKEDTKEAEASRANRIRRLLLRSAIGRRALWKSLKLLANCYHPLRQMLNVAG